MKSYSVVVVTTAALALFTVNASAKAGREIFIDEGVCGIEKTLHTNLASLITDETSVRTLNVLQDIVKNTCINPAAHNAIVSLFDAVMDVTTNEVVAQTLGDLLYVARKVLKEPEFRVVWQEMMKGLNMVFNHSTKVQSLLNMLFINISELIHTKNFNRIFENVVVNIIPLMKYQNLPLVGMFSKMLIMGGENNGSSHSSNTPTSRMNSKHRGPNGHGRSKQRRSGDHKTGNTGR